MPAWVDHAIWWQVYPLGFVGAPRSAAEAAADAGTEAGLETGLGSGIQAAAVPRLRAVEPWLKYLVELGCNGLALGPVFASSSHGYDTVDHFRVDPRLGTSEDLLRLFGACHDAGVRVLLDGVFNHVGREFPRFADVRRNGPAGSSYADWFHLDPAATGELDGFGYRDFEGHSELVALNHDNPAVVDYVVDVMSHWLAAGADGWRLDAAYALPMPFLRAVSDRVRRAHPRAWLVGEVIHGDYPAFVSDGGLDSVTQYELWKAVWSSLNDRNFFELAWALDRHDAVVAKFAPATFVGNHDVTRLASRLTEEAHLDHALVVLFTVGGVPSVYYGDEQAFRGVKEERAGGDDAIRPAFPAHPDDLAPFGWPTYRRHQDLIGLRRRHAWLAHARTSVDHVTNEQLAYTSRGSSGRGGGDGGGTGDNRLTVLLNVADHDYRFPGDEPVVVETSNASRGAGVGGRPSLDGGADPRLVPAHSWTILRPA